MTYSPREVFEKVKDHLLKQKCQSVSMSLSRENAVACMYRGDVGRMCAIGCLIDDEYYQPTLERQPEMSADVLHALEKSGVPLDLKTRSMLEDLQFLHDSTQPARWENALNKVFMDYQDHLKDPDFDE